MSDRATVTVNMGKKCRRCGKPGATGNGLCLRCVVKAIDAGEFDHILRPDADHHGIGAMPSAVVDPEETPDE